MNTKTATVDELMPRKAGLVVRIAERYGVDPDKMLATLKATAFKQSNGQEVTNEQMMALLVLADLHRLNPFSKEIFAFADRGGIVAVVSIDGWARIVNEHEQFDGVRFQFDPDGNECTCIMFRRDRAHPVEVTEYLKECKRNTPSWNSHPRRMLRHKAYIQCARIAFGFGGLHDEDEAQRIIEKDITPAMQSVEHTRALLRDQPATVLDVTAPAVATVLPQNAEVLPPLADAYKSARDGEESFTLEPSVPGLTESGVDSNG